MPKVSVIIPAYNCELYIGDCLKGITAQSERDLEIIVVNDGSTDRTLDRVQQLASCDPRISVYSRPNSGYAGAARNHGLAHATGRYIAFLDADDLYHFHRIERALSVVDHFPDADIVFHDHKRFRTRPEQDETKSFLEKTEFLDRAAAYLQEVGNQVFKCRKDFYNFISVQFIPFHTSSIMIRREILSGVGPWFREDVYPGEDGDLWLRLSKGRRIAFLNEVLSYYREWPGGITRDQARYLRTSIRIHMDNLRRGMDVFSQQEIKLYRSKIAQQLSELGYEYLRQSNVALSRRAYRQSMKFEYRTGTLAAYLKSFVPRLLVGYCRLAGGRLRRTSPL
jgi:glycosyltransferase involved in cell wall biosynthesis